MMKKLFLIFDLLIFTLIITFIPNVKALTIEQQNNIATYAKELILKGNARKAKDGTPLLKYGSSSSRLPAFDNQLYNGHFVFNCDSLVSYVLNRTYGIPVIKSWGSPWTVISYKDAGSMGKIMYNVVTGSYSSIKPHLVKGDIVLCFDKRDDASWEATHVFLYIGDGLIAQARWAGLFVQTFDSYAHSYARYRIVRINDNAPTKPVDMSIIWPDTLEKEILGYDAKPEIAVNYNQTILPKLNLQITFKDDKELVGYQIKTINETPDNWISLNKKTQAVIDYLINENGKYYIYVIDSKKQITYKEINITNIDNTKPVIEKITYSYNDNDTFTIDILAQDEHELTYSLDGNLYKQNAQFTNLPKNNYVLYVQDIAGNITTENINLTNDYLPKVNVTYDTNYSQMVTLNITKTQDNIIGYRITNSKTPPIDYNVFDNDITYRITQNGTYYIWTKNSLNISIYQAIVINNIDNTKPIINDVRVIKEKLASYDIKIEAYDLESGIAGYSIDGINFYQNNIIEGIDESITTIYVKDKCNNIATFQVNFTNNNNYTYLILGLIGIVSLLLIIVIYKTIQEGRRHY